MDDITKLIINKLEKIDESVSNIDITLAKQEEQIKIHIHRTDLLEEKIAPIEKHMIMVNGALKFVGAVALFIGIIEGLLRIFVG